MNDEFRGEKSPANIGDFTDKDSSMTMVSASKLGPIETGEIWDGEPGWFRLDFSGCAQGATHKWLGSKFGCAVGLEG